MGYIFTLIWWRLPQDLFFASFFHCLFSFEKNYNTETRDPKSTGTFWQPLHQRLVNFFCHELRDECNKYTASNFWNNFIWGFFVALAALGILFSSRCLLPNQPSFCEAISFLCNHWSCFNYLSRFNDESDWEPKLQNANGVWSSGLSKAAKAFLIAPGSASIWNVQYLARYIKKFFWIPSDFWHSKVPFFFFLNKRLHYPLIATRKILSTKHATLISFRFDFFSAKQSDDCLSFPIAFILNGLYWGIVLELITY